MSKTTTNWYSTPGVTLGGVTVGHLAKMNGNTNVAFIIGVWEDVTGVRVLLDFPEPQPAEGPEGKTSSRFDISACELSSTWRPGATVNPHRKPGLPDVQEFGSAPNVVPKGYSWIKGVQGTVDEVRERYRGQYVVIVKSAELLDQPGRFEFGIFAWEPIYNKWRHGGWYVSGVSHPNGGCGCVSSNYDDRKWRIVCDPRRQNLNEPGDFTFPSRDAAARAELELTLVLKEFWPNI